MLKEDLAADVTASMRGKSNPEGRCDLTLATVYQGRPSYNSNVLHHREGAYMWASSLKTRLDTNLAVGGGYHPSRPS